MKIYHLLKWPIIISLIGPTASAGSGGEAAFPRRLRLKSLKGDGEVLTGPADALNGDGNVLKGDGEALNGKALNGKVVKGDDQF